MPLLLLLQVGSMLRLGNKNAPSNRSTAAYRETVSAAVSSGLPVRRTLARLQCTAEVLSSHGQWEAGSELLLTGLQFLNAEAASSSSVEGARREPVRCHFLTRLCFFLIDKIYSGTYVNPSESREVYVAVTSGRQAVAMARSLQELDETAGVPSTTPPSAGGLSLPLCQALIAAGRAYGIAGQHLGLGAMPGEYRALLPSSQDVFDEAVFVLTEAAESASRVRESAESANQPNTIVAHALAARGEVYYCAASANTRGAGVLGSDIIGLTLRSTSDMRKSLELLEAAGATRTRLAATVMKDLGKVYGFMDHAAEVLGVNLHAAGYPAAHASPREEASSWLLKAVELQEELVGRSHRSARNARRLMRGRDGEGHEEDSDGQSDDREEDEEEGGGYADSLAAAVEAAGQPGGRVAGGGGASPRRCAVC